MIFFTLHQNISFVFLRLGLVFLRLGFDRLVPKQFIFSYKCVAPKSDRFLPNDFIIRTKCFWMLLILLEYFPPKHRNNLIMKHTKPPRKLLVQMTSCFLFSTPRQSFGETIQAKSIAYRNIWYGKWKSFGKTRSDFGSTWNATQNKLVRKKEMLW